MEGMLCGHLKNSNFEVTSYVYDIRRESKLEWNTHKTLCWSGRKLMVHPQLTIFNAYFRVSLMILKNSFF